MCAAAREEAKSAEEGKDAGAGELGGEAPPPTTEATHAVDDAAQDGGRPYGRSAATSHDLTLPDSVVFSPYA